MGARSSRGDQPDVGTVDRITPNDLTTLVTDRGAAPMNIAAVLVVEGGGDLAREDVLQALERGAPAVPRLHRRLRSAPLGCGRPYWCDDEGFDVARHLRFREVEGEDALWAAAAEEACRPLPRDRPLWQACWVTGLGGDRAALVVVAHHVLADGLGGLAVLGALTDAPPAAPPTASKVSKPTRRELAADAWCEHLRTLQALGDRARLARSGARDLGVGSGAPRPRLCPRTPFNRPTGPTRRISCVQTPLADVLAAAHRLGVTLNDLLLSAVAHALAESVAERGRVDSVVVSVPYSGRTSASAGRLGNETGVVPFRIPVKTTTEATVRAVAAVSRAQRTRPRAASAAPLNLAFRALARLGVFRWFVDHQRLVNTYVSNMRGPSRPWTFCGQVVNRVVPVAVTPGNTGVIFDVLSYAGTLAITVVRDPDVVPDGERLVELLEEEMAALVRSPSPQRAQ
ncbi:wax ester/triacylglycerol synthase domain-containing protein [Terrabacter sp. NPDC080008]|uniref:wax ester/triacylglycerol synthase domain-containing protein n=1 Tax=Terrabacter sp. NPDC080008 TaxID=3155176 RepID=UPI00344BF78B